MPSQEGFTLLSVLLLPVPSSASHLCDSAPRWNHFPEHTQAVWQAWGSPSP